MAKNAIIVSAGTESRPSGLSFWTGKRWAEEYPEAQLYGAGEALRVCKVTSFDRPVQVVVDYGTADEHVAT